MQDRACKKVDGESETQQIWLIVEKGMELQNASKSWGGEMTGMQSIWTGGGCLQNWEVKMRWLVFET